jgi:hypothetical protein
MRAHYGLVLLAVCGAVGLTAACFSEADNCLETDSCNGPDASAVTPNPDSGPTKPVPIDAGSGDGNADGGDAGGGDAAHGDADAGAGDAAGDAAHGDAADADGGPIPDADLQDGAADGPADDGG